MDGEENKTGPERVSERRRRKLRAGERIEDQILRGLKSSGEGLITGQGKLTSSIKQACCFGPNEDERIQLRQTTPGKGVQRRIENGKKTMFGLAKDQAAFNWFNQLQKRAAAGAACSFGVSYLRGRKRES